MEHAGDTLRQLSRDKAGLAESAPTLPLLKQQEGSGSADEHHEITPQQARLMETAAEITLTPATADDACYLHAVLCQVGMPRRKMPGLTFDRISGNTSLRITAGSLWDGRVWQQQPLPYGPKPRLILINVSTQALVTGNPVVDVGRSTREFMERVGLDPQGSEYRSLRKQIGALAVCRLQLGTVVGGRLVQMNTEPIRRFDLWLVPNAEQQTLWPGQVELSQEYFDGIREHAVPLDERAVTVLRGSALALDIYTWLAHRLFRVRERGGAPVRWAAIKNQFGQEYRSLRAFREEFRETLRRVLQVYPGAKIEEKGGNLILRHSPPPIPPRTSILVP